MTRMIQRPIANIRNAAAVTLAVASGALLSCRHEQRSGPVTMDAGSGGAQHALVADAGAPTQELHRAVCGAVQPSPIASGATRESVDFALQDGRVRNDRGVLRAVAGWVCILESTSVVQGVAAPREGVAPTAGSNVVRFDPEQRQTAPFHAGNTSYLLTMVDDTWLATLRHEADTLGHEEGPALTAHCARLGTVAPPDPAAMQARVAARVQHFLQTGSPDVEADGGAGPGAETLLETIAARCGFGHTPSPPTGAPQG